MGFGNPASTVHVERKRHHAEVQRLRAQITALEADLGQTRSELAYEQSVEHFHFNACPYWRGRACTCAPAATA